MILSTIVAHGNTLTALEKQSLESYKRLKTKELSVQGRAEGRDDQQFYRVAASLPFVRRRLPVLAMVFGRIAIFRIARLLALNRMYLR
jgi:hypothetical protein